MTSYLLAIDQGTSSCRAIVFNDKGGIEVVFQREFPLYYPHPGWVEQDPQDILSGTLWALQGCAQYCRDKGLKIAACGITNQRETTILWDRQTGKPVYNAIVWQDRRTTEYCATLRGNGFESEIQEKTGLLLDPYFSATKIKWILDNVEGVRARMEQGEVAFGTVDSFLLWHLSEEQKHMTDITNASRTMMANIKNKKWDKNLLEIFGIKENILPNIGHNIFNFGQLKNKIFDQKIPILSMVGDQQGAMIGQGCITSGITKITYGTGCFALMNIGSEFRQSYNRLLTTIGYMTNSEMTYALEGSIFNAGTAIQFLRDNFGFFHSASETEALATSVDNNGGIYFVPALTGLGAPYWKPDARGLISGLDRHTNKAHIIRAALEAQAYQTRDLLTAMEQDASQRIRTIRADGGLVANKFMCQFLADITQRNIEIPKIVEATAWGAAILAGVGAGVFSSVQQASQNWGAEYVYVPKMSQAEADRLYQGWQHAVQKCVV